MSADPHVLGRGVVVSEGLPAGGLSDASGGSGRLPAGDGGVARVVVSEDTLANPAETVALLHEHWLRRTPVVVELATSASDLRAPETESREPWEVGDRFEFTRERLQFLVWANNWDARSGEPIWWWGRKAARLGATVGGPADVILADGTPAFVDGGPSGPIGPASEGAAGATAVVSRDAIEAGTLDSMRWRAPSGVDDLAPDQLAAVTHRVGAARIIAPAGSGKTRVLTHRLRHLLDDQGVERSSVTAVAFNRRAADELLARTPGLGAHVRTINALGLAVLTGALGGPSPPRRPTVIDEPEVRRVLDGIVDVRRQANTDVLAPYLEGLSAIRIGLRDPAEVERAIPDAQDLTAVWPRYREALDRAGVIDFDDQIDGAIRRLLVDPDVRQAAQRRCRHLLVDEFQDLAPGHLLLLRLLAAPTYDVFGVGDDDQVIYGYAGATPSYLIDFERWFPGATHHALEVNYRCPVEVVDAARHLLSYNRRRIVKTILTPVVAVAPQAAAGGPALRVAPQAAAGGPALDVRAVPAPLMAGAVVDLALKSGRPAGDIAILARVNSSLLPVQIALGDAGVPTNSPLDRRVLERTGVRTALAWLRLGADPGRISRADLSETIRRPSRRISRNVVDMLTKRAHTSVVEIRRLADRLSGGDVQKLEAYASDIEAVAAAIPSGTSGALASIRTTVGLGQAMDTLDSSRAEADRSSHGDDLRALEQVAALHPDAATFHGWLEARLTGGRVAAGRVADGRVVDEPVVTLSTVHRVKGQEWPLVVIFGVDQEAFPHRLATDVEEERRVFHVALTRASARAVVIADQAAPSPFVAELDGSRPAEAVDGRVARSSAVAANRAGSAAAKAAAASAAALDGATVEPELWEALRTWRRETAQQANVPAYVVLSDADLRGVAQRRPATIAELAQCRGFGPTKLERYGDELLAVLDSTG